MDDPLVPPPPDSEEIALQEAPEAADDAYALAKQREKSLRRTVEGLGLDLAAARSGRPWLLLPREVRMREGGAEKWPLPKETRDLMAVAELEIKPNTRHAGAIYVRRCRAALKRRAQDIKYVHFEAKQAEVDELAERMRGEAEAYRKQMAEEGERVRLEAAKMLVSMQDLSSLAKITGKIILEAFINNKEINGALVTVKEASDVMGKIQTNIARIGGGILDDQAKGQAEDEVMKEFAEATRERLKKELSNKVGSGTTN